jgi:hypothetical protein
MRQNEYATPATTRNASSQSAFMKMGMWRTGITGFGIVERY